MLSRSMLLEAPDGGDDVRDEMVCRLEPETLRWLDISPPLAAFLGGTADSLAYPTLPGCLHPDDRPTAQTEFRLAARKGERHDFVLRIRGPSGEWHHLRFFTQARYDRQGRIHLFRCNLKDITDRVLAEQELQRRTEQLTAANELLRETNEKLKQAQSRLVHSEKLAALGTLAAGMAHEINNPLAFASNNAAVLERDVSALLQILAAYEDGRDALAAASPDLIGRIDRLQDDADLPYLREHLVGVAQGTRRGLLRVAQILKNLRGFAQLDRAEVGEVDLNESLDQAIELLGNHLARLRIEVVRDYSPLPRLGGAPADLNQALFNLLINATQAVEATGRGSGTLRVSTRLDAAEILVSIADDGCGIAPDVLPKVFDPFFTTKPVGQGTGLGLSLSLGVVADHGGRIEVDSAVGRGTTVVVRLPVERERVTP